MHNPILDHPKNCEFGQYLRVIALSAVLSERVYIRFVNFGNYLLKWKDQRKTITYCLWKIRIAFVFHLIFNISISPQQTKAVKFVFPVELRIRLRPWVRWREQLMAPFGGYCLNSTSLISPKRTIYHYRSR